MIYQVWRTFKTRKRDRQKKIKMSDLNVRPLLNLLEAMIDLAAPKVNVKPGGYTEEIFLNLTPEQKEEFECSIW